MKILLINNFHYRRGGSEAVYFNMAQMFLRHGHKVIFFSCKDERNEACAQSEYFTESVSSLSDIRGGIRYFYNSAASKNLEKLITAERPDIAHVHLFWGGISPSIFAVLKRHNIPLVHTAHDYRMVCPAYTFRTPDGTICEKCGIGNYMYCLRHRCSKGSILKSATMAAEMYIRNRLFNPALNIDGFVFVSHFAEEKHLQYMPQLSSVARIVAYNTTPELDERFVSRGKGKYMLFFGRLSYEKGVNTLIDAFISRSDVRLKIVGTGPEEGALKQRVAWAKAENIEFVGYRNGDELKEIVRDASFVIVPSEWYENNPMTIVEAYSAGVPVIGAHIGGIPEIIDEEKTGFMFEPGNARQLAACIEKAARISDTEYAAMSRNARDFADRNFNEEQNYNKILRLYNRILAEYEK